MSNEEAIAQRPVRRWRWWFHLIVIGGYPLLSLRAVWSPVARGPMLTSTVSGLLVVCALNVALFAVIFALGWLASRASREELLLPWKRGWLLIPLGIGYSVSIRLAVALVFVAINVLLLATQIFTPQELQQSVTANRPNVEVLVDVEAMRQHSTYFWLTMTLASFVVAGLCEEVWRSSTLAGLRALWPATFGGRIGEFAAVVLIALVFGVGHLQMGVMAAGTAALLGVCLGAIMIVHQSIWPAVIAHGMFDATSFALLPWAKDERTTTASYPNPLIADLAESIGWTGPERR